MQVGARVRVTPNCRAARLAGRTGTVVSLGRQVGLQLDGGDNQLSKVNRNEVVLVNAAASTGANKVRGCAAPLAPAPVRAPRQASRSAGTRSLSLPPRTT